MHHFDWFSFLSSHTINEANVHVVSTLFVAILLIGIAFYIHKALLQMEKSLVPPGKFTLANLFEVMVEGVLNLMEGILGPQARKHLPLIGTLFIYILFSNLLSVIPGFLPPTNNVNTNFACAISVFLYYNYVGIKEQGLKNYLKHFMGPIGWLAPMMIVVELIGHLVRPVSLSLRLFGNITGDHLVLGIFSSLVPLVVPVIFMMLGIFVAFIQAFVFTLLSTIYIGLASSHEEHAH